MSTASYNCPCCGGPLKFSGESGRLECAACGNSYEPEALEMLNASESGEQISFERPKEGFRAEEGVQAYLCKNCGAELITEDTTTAAECPYCGSPTILPDRIEGGVKPEKVIPFVVTKEHAQKQFEDYFKGKRLLPNIFLNSRNRISEMRRLYVPYWLFSCDACEKRAVERVEHSVEQTMLDTVRDYDTVNERNRRITTERGSATPALLPVWLMTTVKEGKTYTFAVNGQTGKLTCDVPADKKKSLLWGGGVFAGILGVAALILALMDALGSGSLLICAVVAAIIALAVVGALKGQLKQAAQQSAAGGYIREGSFRLDVNADHFLYESTTKRKIENNTQKK